MKNHPYILTLLVFVTLTLSHTHSLAAQSTDQWRKGFMAECAGGSSNAKKVDACKCIANKAIATLSPSQLNNKESIARIAPHCYHVANPKMNDQKMAEALKLCKQRAAGNPEMIKRCNIFLKK